MNKNCLELINRLKGKKVLLYGADKFFEKLYKRYPFSELNIVAISDKKFKRKTFWNSIIAIPSSEILNIDFDIILVTAEFTKPILNFIHNELDIVDDKIETIIKEDYDDEYISYCDLKKYKFANTLQKLTKKFKNKKIVVYGVGALFRTICKYYDISSLNICAVSDVKFKTHEYGETYLNYPVCSPDEIIEIAPDYVLVGTRFYLNIIEHLHFILLKKSKIKIKPLLKKNFLTLLKEIVN